MHLNAVQFNDKDIDDNDDDNNHEFSSTTHIVKFDDLYLNLFALHKIYAVRMQLEFMIRFEFQFFNIRCNYNKASF